MGESLGLARNCHSWFRNMRPLGHVSLTHGEIGECIGTCRESVTRILGDMQRRQIVNLHGSILTVTNRSALEDCAGI